MYVAGNGITPFYTWRFKYKVKTTPSYKWLQVNNDFFTGIDRGASEDLYESEIEFYGTQTDIDNILDQFQNNRDHATPNYLTLSDFNEYDDNIFGTDIDYSGSLTACITKLGKRKQKSWKIFTFTVTLQLMSSYSYAGTAQMPTKFNLDYQYEAYNTWTNLPVRLQDNTLVHMDRDNDVGVWKGRFIMPQSEMRDFRRYLLTTIRIDSIELTSTNFADCLKVFGPRAEFPNLPMDVYVIEFDDQMLNRDFWVVKLTLAEKKFYV